MNQFDDELLFLPGEISEKVLVIGGGIAGLRASLDIADLGHEVVLAEREPSLGGRVAQLSAMYPGLDHPVCLLREMMVRVWENPRVTVLTNAQIDYLEGYAGCFEASIKLKARRVTESSCNGCGKCWRACPVKVESEFDLGMGTRPAIYLPYPQAIPAVPVIDERSCLQLQGRVSSPSKLDAQSATGCNACREACPRQCIDFEQTDSEFSGKFGAVVLATGLKICDPAPLAKYGYGRYPDVITSLQLERMLASAGPTKGEVYRPSDGLRPKSVAFVCYDGSRDSSLGRPYCPVGCWPNTAKQVLLLKRLYGSITCYVFHPGITGTGKGIEEMVRRAREEFDAGYLQAVVEEVVPVDRSSKWAYRVRANGMSPGQLMEEEVDLVVLAVGQEAWPETIVLAGGVGAMCDEHGYIMEAQRQLQPVETTAPGVFVAGSASGPKDIGESVAQGSAAALRATRFVQELAARGHAAREFGLSSAD